MNYIIPIITTLASLITIEEWIRRGFSKRIHRAAMVILVVILTCVSTVLWQNASKEQKIRKKAQALLTKVDATDHIRFQDTAELLGFISSTLVFLEQYYPHAHSELKEYSSLRVKNMADDDNVDSVYHEINNIQNTAKALKICLETIADE